MTFIPGTRSRRTRIVLWVIGILAIALLVWVGWLVFHTPGFQTQQPMTS